MYKLDLETIKYLYYNQLKSKKEIRLLYHCNNNTINRFFIDNNIIERSKEENKKIAIKKRNKQISFNTITINLPQLSKEEIQQKKYQQYQKTCFKKYGVDNYFKLTENIKIAMKKKHGVEIPLKSKIIQNKMKQTNINKYHCENVFQNEDIKNKIKQNNFKNFGVEYNWQREDVKEKIKQTMIKRHGVDNIGRIQNPIKNEKIKIKNKIFWQKLTLEQKRNKINPLKNFWFNITLQQQKEIENKKYQTMKKNNSFNKSKDEEDFLLWLKNNNIEYIRQYKDKRYNFNCDFYIPKLDLFIELNKGFFHNCNIGLYDKYNINHHKEVIKILKKSYKLHLINNKKNRYDNLLLTWIYYDPIKYNFIKKLNHFWIYNENNLNECKSFLIEKFNNNKEL